MASIGIGALGEPAIAHVLEPLLGHALGHGAAVVIAVVIDLPADHDGADHGRRDGPEALRDPAPRGGGPPDRAAAAVLPGRVQPVHRRAERLVTRDAAHAGDRSRRRARRRHARRDQADHRRVADRRPARCRRGQHAHRRVPSARAGGAPGDDADPGRGHRRPAGKRDAGAASAASRPATRAWSSPRTRTRIGSRGSSTSTSWSSC